MARILITGAAGFIGSHLAERLLDEGQRVLALDSFDPFYDPAIKRENIRRALAHPQYRLVQADIRDSAALEALFAGEPIDAVIHLAARAGVRPSILDPVLYSSVNLDGTTRLLEACRKHGIRRFVFGSSSSVYGNNAKVPFAETDRVDEPISPYAATKKAGELLCHAYHELCGMSVACLRFFTVYGPRQRPEMAIHHFARRMRAGEEIELYGDSRSARDYTFILDIVEGVLRALARSTDYHIWNLGGSQAVPLEQLVSKLAARLGVEPRIKRLPAQPGDVERTWADISLARRELDWSPTTDLDRGLELFLLWLERQSSG